MTNVLMCELASNGSGEDAKWPATILLTEPSSHPHACATEMVGPPTPPIDPVEVDAQLDTLTVAGAHNGSGPGLLM